MIFFQYIYSSFFSYRNPGLVSIFFDSQRGKDSPLVFFHFPFSWCPERLKRFYRTGMGRVGGVCGNIADYILALRTSIARLLARLLLWTCVYIAPINRFRTTLLEGLVEGDRFIAFLRLYPRDSLSTSYHFLFQTPI